MNNNVLLGILLTIGVFLGLGFWAYYGSLSTEENIGKENVSQSPSTSNAEESDYSSKLKVTFTNTVYPLDEYQQNPRLKTYIGKIQNTGDKTVEYVSIKVVYLDKGNRGIWDEDVVITKTLKSNFIEEFRFGGLKVPSEWSGDVAYELNGLRLAGSTETRFTPSYQRNAPLDRPLQNILLFP